MSLKGILFDFDGTLADSENGHRDVWNDILAEFSVELDKETYKSNYSGIPAPAGAKRMVEDYDLPIESDELVKRKVERTVKHFSEQPVELMAHAREILEWAKDRGLRTALVTGSGRDELMPTVKHHELEKYFEFIITRNDVENSKPDPECYLKMMEQLGLSAEECLVMEDTEHGVKAGRNAGIEVIAVPNEYSVEHDFSDTVYTATDLKQAIEWIERHRLNDSSQ
ncbi:HAD family hydrolase [Phytohalomonas tamaricis]|uniref:HAD family hydrolase n=1 Tax=Phytohalomonas tamaricis TaxID=2081032 RepID=UPI000D0BDA89|nr:HAD family phosphatase [Phytohalomonas tamaricis]